MTHVMYVVHRNEMFRSLRHHPSEKNDEEEVTDGCAVRFCGMDVCGCLFERIPGAYGHAFFSALAPGTHVTPHHGPTNKKLRLHLPLVIPPPPGRRDGM